MKMAVLTQKITSLQVDIAVLTEASAITNAEIWEATSLTEWSRQGNGYDSGTTDQHDQEATQLASKISGDLPWTLSLLQRGYSMYSSLSCIFQASRLVVSALFVMNVPRSCCGMHFFLFSPSSMPINPCLSFVVSEFNTGDPKFCRVGGPEPGIKSKLRTCCVKSLVVHRTSEFPWRAPYIEFRFMWEKSGLLIYIHEDSK